MYSDLTLRLHSSRLREGTKEESGGFGADGAAPVPGAGAAAAVSSMTPKKYQRCYLVNQSNFTGAHDASSTKQDRFCS